MYRTSYTNWKHLKKIVLMNKNMQINYISDVLIKKWYLQNINRLLVKAKVFQKDMITFINIYKIKIQVYNDVAREYIFI